jgi:hypothetical protein
MNCDFIEARNREVETLLDDYLTGRLAKQEAEAFELHYLGCDECFHKLRIREQMMGVVQEKGEMLFADLIQKEKNKEERNILHGVLAGFSRLVFKGRRRWVYAMGLAIALLGAGLFWIKGKPGPPPEESYRAYVYFEELIANQEFRRAGEAISILSPMSGFKFQRGEQITFRWEIQDHRPVKLEIMNNKGDELFNVATEDDSFLFKENLAPGLYYWKIKTADDFRMGKFYVD